MLNLSCRIAPVVLLIFGSLGPTGQAFDYAPAVAGGWGFDLAGANFAKKPGDDFFRYANGTWYERTVIPIDRSSIGPSDVLSIMAEARIREILEDVRDGIDPSALADAAKIGAFFAAYMDEARAEALDTQPIASLIAMIRSASNREEFADLIGASVQVSDRPR